MDAFQITRTTCHDMFDLHIYLQFLIILSCFFKSPTFSYSSQKGHIGQCAETLLLKVK